MHISNRKTDFFIDHTKILEGFGLKHCNILDMPISGSPERTVFRTIVQDTAGQKYILEQIARKQLDRKRSIAEHLSELSKSGLQVEPYLECSDGGYILEEDSRFYQITRFIEGILLPRPNYAKEAWRGKVLAEFLLRLKSLNYAAESDVDLRSYIKDLMVPIKENHPKLFDDLVPCIRFLEDGLFKRLSTMQSSFSHGDFHPINVIWGEDKINSVIDWEFFGSKPELYDAANMLGCVGIEHPNLLADSLAMEFISQLKKGDYKRESWQYLIDLIVANRFAWLSEWCRKDDSEMQALEIVYMRLLIDSRKDLMRLWGIE
jgi:homoserine kinase type II